MDSVNRIFADIYGHCAAAASAPPSLHHADFDLELRPLESTDEVVGSRASNPIDLLVGFYLSPGAGRTSVELSCSDREVFECALVVPGKVTFALDGGRFILPLISLQFEEVRVRCFTGRSNVMMVVARLRDIDTRVHLAAYPWSCMFETGEMFIIAGGTITRSTSESVAQEYRVTEVLPAAADEGATLA